MWGGVFGGAVAGWVVGQTDWPTAFLVGAGLAITAGLAALALRPPSETRPKRPAATEADVEASD